MGKITYESWEDVRLRLHRTACMFEGEPVFVTNDGIDGRNSLDVWISPLSNLDDRRRIPHQDPGLEYMNLPLGYCLHKRIATYATRVPERRQKQGLDQTSIRLEPHISGFWLSKSMANCMKGENRTLDEAISMIENKEVESVPLSRDLAIGLIPSTRRMLGLYYRSRMIASKSILDRRFSLFPSKDSSFFLRLMQDRDLI